MADNSPSQATTALITSADGMGIHCTHLAGEGNLLVALHGFTGDGSTMAPLVDRIRGSRPAVLVDLIGHGGSQAPEHLEHYSMASVVDQVLSIIGPHQPGTVHLLGYSMGGRVALSMAARAPWYFASITLLSASAGIEDPTERSTRHDADLALAERLEEIGLDAFVDEWLSNKIFESYVAGLTAAELAVTKAQRDEGNVVGWANSLRGTGTGAMPPLWAVLPSIRSPFLAVAGSLDQKYRDLAERLASAVHAGQHAIIEGAGHVVHRENLLAVASIVGSFLKECDGDEDHQR